MVTHPCPMGGATNFLHLNSFACTRLAEVSDTGATDECGRQETKYEVSGPANLVTLASVRLGLSCKYPHFDKPEIFKKWER